MCPTTVHVQGSVELESDFRWCSTLLIFSIACLVIACTSMIPVRALLKTYRGARGSWIVARMRPLTSRYVQPVGTPRSCTVKELSRADESLAYAGRA